MKQSDREKDWDYVTGIAVKMLERGDLRGWLYVFDAELLLQLAKQFAIPDSMISQRPTLVLALDGDQRLRAAVTVERDYWRAVNSARLKVYAKALRPYALAVRKELRQANGDLMAEHAIRVACANDKLADRPLRDCGVDRIIEEAHNAVSRVFRREVLQWLPNVTPVFRELLA
jgi:hypothetical protein